MPDPDSAQPLAPSLHLQAVTPREGYPYLLSLPKAAVKPTRRRWPLLLFLHGKGERGVGLTQVARWGLPRLLAGGADLGDADRAIGETVARQFIVAAPQCGLFEAWEDRALLSLLDRLLVELPCDPARVCLTGMSMGGFGTWVLGVSHPERFAALVPVCGGGRVRDVLRAAGRRRRALQTLPVRAYHGAKDRVVPLEESERMVAALQQSGAAHVRLRVYPEAGHDAWTPAYSNPGLYRWLRRQKRQREAR